jgi:hypothetical protein
MRCKGVRYKGGENLVVGRRASRRSDAKVYSVFPVSLAGRAGLLSGQWMLGDDAG